MHRLYLYYFEFFYFFYFFKTKKFIDTFNTFSFATSLTFFEGSNPNELYFLFEKLDKKVPSLEPISIKFFSFLIFFYKVSVFFKMFNHDY